MAEDVDTLFPQKTDQLQDVDELFPTKPVGQSSSPVYDTIFGSASNPVSHVLNAFGQGVKQGWGSDRLGMSDETTDYLKKAGVFNDYEKGQSSIIKAANEVLMRSAAMALRVPSALTAGVASVAQYHAEAQGLPELGRDIAALPEAFPLFGREIGGAGIIPHLPPQLAQARALGVIGEGEAGWKGTAPKAELAPGADAEAVKQIVDEQAETQQPGAAPSPTGEGTPPTGEASPAEAATPIVPSPKIVADVTRQVIAAGRPAEEAEAYAQIVSAYWQTRAERFKGAKGTAEEMYAAEGPEIKAGVARDKVLAQRKVENELEQPADFHNEGLAYLLGPKSEVGVIGDEVGDVKPNGISILNLKNAPEGYEGSRVVFADDGKIVGAMQITKTPDGPYTVANTYVAPEYRRQGIATELNKAAVKKLGELQRSEEPSPAGQVFRESLAGGEYEHLEQPANSFDSLQALRDHWTERGVRNFIADRPTRNELRLSDFVVPEDERGQGVGTQFMNDLAAYADREGRTITLTPDVSYGASSISRLKDFYKRFGFVENKGRNKDFAISDSMYREPNDAAINQGFPLFQGAKGRIRLRENARSTMTILKNGDASTLIHETGHDWLPRLLRDGDDPLAPPDLKADAATMLNWLGMKDASELSEALPSGRLTARARNAHEQFARAAETYIMEGRAPSPALATVFAKFRDWLTTIYRTVSALKSPISDDIRRVFDRLLATNPGEPIGDLLLREPAREESPPLLSFLASRGGIRNDDGNIGDLRASIGADNKFIPGFGQLIRNPAQLSTAAIKSGRSAPMPLDTAREAAIEAGYLPQDTTLPEFLEALDQELRGGHKGERPVEEGEQEHIAHSFVDGVNDFAKENGGAELTAKERERALELWRRDGLNDPADIFERLALESSDKEIAEGTPARPESVPGWDVPFESEPAPRGSTEAPPVEPEQPGGVAARPSGEGAREEPVLVTDPLPKSETHFIDKAGNIRLDNLGTPEDVNAVIRQAAAENEGFLPARRGVVSDAQVLDLADALGVTNVERLLKNRKIGEAFNAESIMAARKLLIQSATAVKDAMAKAAEGTDADVVAYAEARARHLMIQEQVSGITAEAGRALRAFRNLGGDHIKEAQQVTDFLRAATGKTLYQLKKEAQLGLALETTQQISKYMLDSAKPTFGDMILEYWINGLISGPATHTTYSVGNALLALNKAGPETAAAAISSKIFEALGREGSGITLGEAPARLYGLLKGTRDGVMAAYESGKTGRTADLPGELEAMTAQQMANSPLVNPRAAIPNFTVGGVPVPVGTFLRLPSRAVAMIHSFFRSVNYASEMAGLAYRQAVSEGLEGEAFARRIGEVTTDPSAELMQQARASATDLTLMGHGGELTRALSRLTNAKFLGFQWLKFIDPFVHISSNVIEQSILQRTPVGVIDPTIRANLMGNNGAAARDMAIGRMAVGSAIGVAVGSLAAEGLINGSGPSDPKELAIWTMVNGPPHSVRVGDTWYDIHRLGPLGMMVGITADLYHLAHKVGEEDASHIVHDIAHAFTQNILDESFMRGPSDLIRALTDPDRYGASWVRNFAASFTPYSVGMSQVARAIDPYSRNAKTTLDAVRAKTPWLSETLLPRRDIFGEPIPNKDALGLPGLSAIYEQKVNRDPVPRALLEAGIFPAMPQKKLRGVELTPQQYDDLARVAGRMVKMRLDAVVGMPGFNQMPQGVRTELMHKQIEDAHKTAGELMLMQNPQIINQARENKTAKLRGEKPTVH